MANYRIVFSSLFLAAVALGACAGPDDAAPAEAETARAAEATEAARAADLEAPLGATDPQPYCQDLVVKFEERLPCALPPPGSAQPPATKVCKRTCVTDRTLVHDWSTGTYTCVNGETECTPWACSLCS
jgi:hypothetical protein